MLSKKTATESLEPKSGLKIGKKKKTESSFDDIRVQAYYNYLRRVKNNAPGDQMGDWLEAEKSVQMSMGTH